MLSGRALSASNGTFHICYYFFIRIVFVASVLFDPFIILTNLTFRCKVFFQYQFSTLDFSNTRLFPRLYFSTADFSIPNFSHAHPLPCSFFHTYTFPCLHFSKHVQFHTQNLLFYCLYFLLHLFLIV